MADRTGKVVALPSAKRASKSSVSGGESWRPIVAQLDAFGFELHRLAPYPVRSARQWMIASTELRMRLVLVRCKLAELANPGRSAVSHVTRWAFELNDVSGEMKQCLDEISEILYALQILDSPPAKRAQTMKSYSISRAESLRVLGELRRLLIEASSKEL